MAIDNVRFIAGAAKMLTPRKELKDPYEACIATFGSEEHTEKVVVSIVDTKRRLVIDHRVWLISEYDDEASGRTVYVLTDDMMNYCERSRVGRVFIVDKPFPLHDVDEKYPHCDEERVRVPWRTIEKEISVT